MLKKQVIKVVGDVVQEEKVNLSPLEKFNCFLFTCDKLLEEGRITNAQHYAWTNIF